MIQLADLLHIEFIGPRYLHNIIIHFPIGACGIIILFLIWGRRTVNFSQTVLFLTLLALIFCWISVIAGHLTAISAGYLFSSEKWLLENGVLGHIIVLHRFFGLLESFIMTGIFLFTYFTHKKKQFSTSIILVLHLINFIIISITGHLGASIGHL